MLAALLVVCSTVAAQSSNLYLKMQGYPQHGYIEIPSDTSLDTPQMTVEAWVSIHDAHSAQCSSVAGNGYVSGWWLGLCGTTMRSYFNGTASQKTGGTIPADTWVHIAAVTDGTTRKHYINGDLVFSSAETVGHSISLKAVRIGSDPDWDFMPIGGIDDLRIWSVARTQDQIRQTMFVRYTPQVNTALFSSLEAWYAFEGSVADSWHTHHGTTVGSGVGIEEGPVLPPNQYAKMQGFPQHGYIEIPADTVLDTPQMTVEAWVSVHDAHTPSACSSIAGNGYTTGWWLGLCGTSMRSYFNGTNSQKTGGTIPADTWVHIAAVTDGTTRRHYINGSLVFEAAETGARSTSTKPVRIGSDPDWDYMPGGGIDDLRIWSVARTQQQIRETMFVRYAPEVNSAWFSSLEAWYAFEGDATDSWHTHHGTINGTALGIEQGIVFTLPRHRGAKH